jgi:hypothetical protein
MALPRPVFFPIDYDKASLATRQDIARHISNFTFMIQLTPVPARDKSLDHNLLVHTDGLEVFHAQIRRDYVFPVKPGRLAHGFVEQHGDDPAMEKAPTALILITELKPTDDALARVILFECKLHATGICAAAAKARVLRFGIKSHRAP